MATRIPIPVGQQRQSVALGLPAARVPMVAVDDPTGRALGGASDALGQIGTAVQKQQQELEKAEAGRLLSQAALDIDAFQRDKLNNTAPGAKGYADSLSADIDSYIDKGLTTGLSGGALRLYEAGLNDLKARTVIAARDEEFRRSSEYWLGNIKSAQENISRLAYQSPASMESLLAPHLAIIESITDLPAETRLSMQREAIKKVSLAAAYGHAERGEMGPEFLSRLPSGILQSMAETGSSARVPIDSPVQQMVQGTAEAAGLDPAYMLAVAEIESGFDVAAQNPKSSAGGLFQFTDATWSQYGRGAAKGNPSANARAAAQFTLDNQRALASALGRRPLPWELYLAHQQGAGGAAALLRADPRMTVADALRKAGIPNADKAAADNGMEGMSVGGALGMWKEKFSGSYRKFGGTPGQDTYQPAAPEQMPTWWNLLDWTDQRQVLSAAISKQESLLRIANTQEERAERAAAQDEKRVQRATAMEGDSLYASGDLSMEWIEANKSTLSGQDYRYFLEKMGSPPPERTNPETYNELTEMISQGQDVRDAARTALTKGNISTASYSRLISISEKAGLIPEGMPSPYQQGASAITMALKPSDLADDPDAANRAYRAMAEFQDWFDKNPGATRTEVMADADQIIRSYQFIRLDDFVITSPLPRFAVGGNRFDGFDIDATEQATVQAYMRRHGDDLAAVSQDPEFQKQALLIEKWRTVIQEKERLSKEQGNKKNDRR